MVARRDRSGAGRCCCFQAAPEALVGSDRAHPADWPVARRNCRRPGLGNDCIMHSFIFWPSRSVAPRAKLTYRWLHETTRLGIVARFYLLHILYACRQNLL